MLCGFITCGRRSWSWQRLHVTDPKCSGLFVFTSGGPLSALTLALTRDSLSAIKKISPLIYSQSWVKNLANCTRGRERVTPRAHYLRQLTVANWLWMGTDAQCIVDPSVQLERSPHGHIKGWTTDRKWPPIHSYGNCSVAQGIIQERFASALWGQDTWPIPWRTGCRDLLLLLV